MDLQTNGLLFLLGRLLIMLRHAAEVHLDVRVNKVRVVNHVAGFEAPFVMAQVPAVELMKSPARQPIWSADTSRFVVLRKMAHNWVMLKSGLLLTGVSHWRRTVVPGPLVIKTIDYRIASLGN